MLIFIIPIVSLFPGLAGAVDVGEKAPDFKGSSTEGEIKLSDYSGKKNVVLALYFAAFTPL